MIIPVLVWVDYISSKDAHSHSRSNDVFLHPQDLASLTNGIYAPNECSASKITKQKDQAA